MISKDPRSSLPPGFRFHPTDEELILHYLRKKVSSLPVPLSVIADVDIYKSDPWDLPDATDLTFLTNFLNETPENHTEQEFSFMFENFSNPNIYGNPYLDQNLPRLSPPSSETSFIGNKREIMDYAEKTTSTSKKMINNFSYNI
ncbi:hypothetical protein F2Q70_00024042 [Brassica cretica]|uniref:NAC domain-containing protein n=1 Tax=Brassica cretica TaxID=69181 RepID=A0A8S9GWF9_BRACR|nr:hypothetical protein F2Q70_00024042 [Brassica cretica]